MAYSILFKQCGSDHMTRGRSCAIDRIVVHFTATLASARNNATYFARNEGQGASAHYFVDDITPEIYQSVHRRLRRHPPLRRDGQALPRALRGGVQVGGAEGRDHGRGGVRRGD